jgi:hypothetical protein
MPLFEQGVITLLLFDPYSLTPVTIIPKDKGIFPRGDKNWPLGEASIGKSPLSVNGKAMVENY